MTLTYFYFSKYSYLQQSVLETLVVRVWTNEALKGQGRSKFTDLRKMAKMQKTTTNVNVAHPAQNGPKRKNAKKMKVRKRIWPIFFMQILGPKIILFQGCEWPCVDKFK